MYKCSIFCSFYKGQQFIEGYIEDILKQSIFNDIEFIFLDCNSPESEYKYIEPLLSQYKNIKYYKLDNDPGLYAAWNKAVRLCSAPIIGNWNIDDRKNTHSIEILLRALNKDPSLDMAYGITYVSHIANEKYEDNSYDYIYPCTPHSLLNLFKNNSPHCMPLWKKNLHDRFGLFDENYKTASDGDMWLRFAVGDAKIKMVNHPVGLYYHNPTGRSTDPKYLQEMVDEVNRMRQNYIGYLKHD
jgi:hypothetical protein